MRRFTTKLLVLCLATFLGLTAYYFYNLFHPSIPEQIAISDLNISKSNSLPKTETQSDFSEKTDSPSLSPCEKTNPLKEYSAKAVGTRSWRVVNWRVMCGVLPEYPVNKNAASGTVSVYVLIDEYGEVIESEIISGKQIFRTSTLQAARQTRFAPTLLGGQPIKVRGVLIYEFNSNGEVNLQKRQLLTRHL